MSTSACEEHCGDASNVDVSHCSTRYFFLSIYHLGKFQYRHHATHQALQQSCGCISFIVLSFTADFSSANTVCEVEFVQ